MESSIYSPWLAHEQSVHPSPTSPEWPKAAAGPGAPSQPPHHTPTLDLSDFDLASTPSSTNPSASSSSAQPGYGFYGTFYNQSPFYNSAWPSAQSGSPTDSIPLSSYSTLNGATSAGASAPSPAPPQNGGTMMIDPVMTTLSGPGINGSHPPYPPSNYSAQLSSPQQRPYYPTQSLNYYLSQQHSQQPSQSTQPQPQGTLSPRALHDPSGGGLYTSNFFPQQPQASTSRIPQQPHTIPNSLLPQSAQLAPTGPSPEQRKAELLNSIRPFLSPKAFSGAAAVKELTARLSEHGFAEVDAPTRMEILTKIRDYAGNHYFRAWVENQTAIDLTREWLKAAFNASREAGGDEALVETIMPLLHIIDRLPMTVTSLQTSKLGKLVVRLVKDPPSPAIKDMAYNVERRWRQLVTEQGSEAPAEDPKSKKRKLGETSARAAPPLKKAAVANNGKPVVKKESAAAVAAAAAAAASASSKAGAKSDSSFFSAPKPKPKLPSFKKAPPAPPPAAAAAAAAKKDDANIAQPSAIDPFQEALKLMKARKGSPLPGVASAQSPAGSADAATTSTPPSSGLTKLGKRKKTVTWAPDGKLEAIRLIERAIYGDEDADGGMSSLGDVRDLDRSEGAAMHMLVFEEVLDWIEPQPLELPSSDHERGSGSEEKGVQEVREQTALASWYMSASSIPDSPAEPSSVIADEEVDKDVREMTAGTEVDEIFWSSPPIPPPSATNVDGPMPSVADLVGQLVGAGAGGTDPIPMAVDPSVIPQDIHQLLAQLASASGLQPQPQPQPQPTFGGTDWSQFNTDYNAGQPMYDGSDGINSNNNRGSWPNRGRGGRGRGRGRGGGPDDFRHSSKRKLCNFFAQGRCRYGDLCDFSHDMSDM
uniref:MHC class I region proline-rich protein CAT53 n=1 Tax=Mycena chlorophos TaxID=658473 RepID=A0ABQ0L6V6_MYCCL|nr:predicted protein [Mycena chlorophos]